MVDLPGPALGIDYGEARFGIAVSDLLRITARPVETIQVASTDPAARIAELVEEHRASTVVIGLPLRMDGSEGTATEKVRKFVTGLRNYLPDIEIVEVDERLTTVEAHRLLARAGKKSTRENKDNRDIIDQAAATLILQDYLDHLPPTFS